MRPQAGQYALSYPTRVPWIESNEELGALSEGVSLLHGCVD